VRSPTPQNLSGNELAKGRESGVWLGLQTGVVIPPVLVGRDLKENELIHELRRNRETPYKESEQEAWQPIDQRCQICWSFHLL